MSSMHWALLKHLPNNLKTQKSFFLAKNEISEMEERGTAADWLRRGWYHRLNWIIIHIYVLLIYYLLLIIIVLEPTFLSDKMAEWYMTLIIFHKFSPTNHNKYNFRRTSYRRTCSPPSPQTTLHLSSHGWSMRTVRW